MYASTLSYYYVDVDKKRHEHGRQEIQLLNSTPYFSIYTEKSELGTNSRNVEESEISMSAIKQSEIFRDDNPSDNSKSSNDTNDVKEEKWKSVQFGLIHTILSKIFKNVSYRVCGILTILTQVTISISDTISDFAIAITLFSRKHTTLGWAVIIIDYVPGWILAIHNSFSPKWRSAETIKQKVLTTAFLIFSPFSQSLFHLR